MSENNSEEFDFFSSYFFRLITETFYYVTYEGYENARAITGMELETMHEWLQKVNAVEELPESLQTVVKMVENNLDSFEQEEKEAEIIMKEFLWQKQTDNKKLPL
ncbi:MAG: hypothetical protein NC177_09850 [Ruminococcus flavefaciens]|nr:hypothetical protein [Ruminococcus flavefaciens]